VSPRSLRRSSTASAPATPRSASCSTTAPSKKYAPYGLRVELPQVCENASPEVINNLIAG